MRLPRSTFGLVVLVSLGLSAVALMSGAAVLYAAHEALEHQLDRRVATETRALLHLRSQGGDAGLADAIRAREAQRAGDGLHYLLVDAALRRVAGSIEAPGPQPGWQEFLKTPIKGDESGTSQATTTALPGGGRLTVAADRDPVSEVDGGLVAILVGSCSLMLLSGAGGAWLLAAVVKGRLDRINATAEAIVGGDTTRRAHRDGSGSEFDRLAAALNRTLDHNAELLDVYKRLSSDVAHDLRTPLSRLQQSLEGALAAPLTTDTAREALEAAAARAREMLDLFASLLRIAELDTLQVREAFKAVDLSDVVQRVADAFQPDVEATRHTLATNVEDGVRVEGDANLLAQLLVNLTENAMRHTPPGSAITVSLFETGGDAVLQVRDDGPGILAADRVKVLGRFTRLERSRSTPGHGLGLSLVDAIARAHSATLDLADAGPGLAVTVRLRAEAR